MLFADEDRRENPQMQQRQAIPELPVWTQKTLPACHSGRGQTSLHLGWSPGKFLQWSSVLHINMVSMPKTSSFVLPSFYSYSQLIDPWICAKL